MMRNRRLLHLFGSLKFLLRPSVRKCHSTGASLTFPKNIPLPLYLLGEASTYGDQVAMINADTGQKFRYDNLQGDSIKVSNSFFRLGLRRGDVVCLYGSNTPEMLPIFCGVTAIGGIISPAMTQMSVVELTNQLRDCRAKFLITTPECVIRAKAASEKCDNIQEVIVLGQAEGCRPFSDLIKTAKLSFPDISIEPSKDIALMPYSAGISGKPKAVLLTHYNLISAIEALRQADFIPFEPGKDHNVMVFPVTHATGIVIGFGLSLIQGATIITLNRFEARSYLRALQKYNGTFTMTTPSMLWHLNNHPLLKEMDLSSLQTVFSQSAPLQPCLVEQLTKKLNIPHIRQGYGLTEACGVGLATPISDWKSGSVGVPIPGMEVKVIDPNTREELSAGKEGEICLKGPSVAMQFWKSYNENENLLLGDGWIRTGDIGVCSAEGHYTIVDKIKPVIKYKGCQVSPEEIEDLLLNHPAVLDAAVIGLPDAEAGEVPTALVVKQRNVDAKELQNFVSENSASFKQLRGGIKFHPEIPRLPDGSISRRMIRDWFLEFHPLHARRAN